MTPQRSVLERDSKQLLLMPSWDAAAAGVKLVTVNQDNPARDLPLINGVYVLFSGETLEPVAIFDAAPLTALRTAAVSALATRFLARTDSYRVVVFGAGVQGRAHIEAMRSVREIGSVTVISRTQPRAMDLVESLKVDGLDADVGTAADVGSADIVCTCTTARRPLFAGSDLPLGCHVNAVGAHRADARELDTEAIRRATGFVETKEAALAEAGDLLIPLQEAAITENHLKGVLADLVEGATARNHVV